MSPAYRRNRDGMFTRWVEERCGDLPVAVWAGTDDYCQEVLNAAAAAGLSPATLANIAGLLASIAAHARRRHWVAATARPMDDVAYTAGAIERGGKLYVEPKDRPTTGMVEALCAALDEVGAGRDLPWAGLMGEVAAYGGPRFGEQTALGPEDRTSELLELVVEVAWAEGDDEPLVLGPTKNRRVRRTLLPGSLRARMDARAAEVNALVAGGCAGALLFPGPKGPDQPFTEAEWRKLFLAAARLAGWPMIGDIVTPTGLLRGGRAAIPYRNLRHHAAVWMHDVAGMDWADVSRALGHASVAFTIARYVRPGADADARNRRRLEDL